MSVQIQLRRGLAAAWAAANPVLAQAEMGVEIDTQKFKIGNGSTVWNSLPYGGLVGAEGPQGPQGPAGQDGSVISTLDGGNF